MRVVSLNIDFMKRRRTALVLSFVLIVSAVVSLTVKGLNFGLDFTGGTLVEVEFPERMNPEVIRQMLDNSGYTNGVVQYFGTEHDLLIRMPPQGNIEQVGLGDSILGILKSSYPGVVMRQSNYVGPAVGEELTEDGGLAMLSALAVVMLYILFRFTKQFSVGAVAALLHDVIIVVGCFALMGWTFDLAVLAALLAVIGYSLNDTIVVSDRIRENFRRLRKGTAEKIINRSLNETLGRTIVTSLTTLLVLTVLLIAGGEMIRGFAAALTIGVVIGTYSSIYVVTNVLLYMNISREDLLIPAKEESDDRIP
tara:strand:+ start:720 stop:1646 length:927 start_codon:yes stop_codon:yes gene_type:complete